MERLLSAVANRERLAIIDHLRKTTEGATQAQVREALGLAPGQRPQVSRHMTKLHDLAIVELLDDARYVLAEPEMTDRFLQFAADLDASLTARRAKIAGRQARERRKDSLTRGSQAAG